MRFKTRLFGILLAAGLAGVFSFLLVDLSALVALLPVPAGTEIPQITPAIKLLSLIQPAILLALAVLVGRDGGANRRVRKTRSAPDPPAGRRHY